MAYNQNVSIVVLSALDINSSILVFRNDSMTLVSDVLNSFITVFAVLVILTTVLGNSLVILAIIVDKRLRRVGNVFIVSLAVSDILVGIIVAPFALAYQLSGSWTYGRAVCDFWTSMDVIVCTASIMNLCVISYDRYNAITRPLRYTQYRTGKRAILFVVLVWLYSFGIAAPPLLGWDTPGNDVNTCTVSQDIGYTFYSTIGAFYLPLSIMLCFYVKIFRVTWRQGRLWVKGPGTSRMARQLKILRHQNDKFSEKALCMCCLGKEPCSSSNTKVDFSLEEYEQNHSKSKKSEPSPFVQENLQTPNNDFELTVTQDQRKPFIKKRPLFRQISNLASSDSGYTTTTSAGYSETAFSAQSNDIQTKRRMSKVLENLIAANIVEIVALKSGISSVLHDNNSHMVQIPSQDKVTEDTFPLKKDKPEDFGSVPKRQRFRRDTVTLPHERRAVRTLGMVVGCFVFCWLPFFVVALLGPLCPACGIDNIIYGIVLWLGYFNSACNPVIYTFYNKDFRSAFKKIMFCTAKSRPSYL